MTNEEFLKDACPNHTEKSKWNRSELLHILELHEKAINYSQCRKSDSEQLNGLLEFAKKPENEVFSFKYIKELYEQTI